MKTVIIGGVAGGATTAARLRRKDEAMEIVMFERGEYISYANCGLPYYIGDVINKREALLLQSPKGMKAKYNVDVRVSSEVIKILPEEKKVIVRNLKTLEEYDENYDNLVIATGSSPVKPPIKGIELDNIFTLWTIPDTDKIKSFVNQNKPDKAVVIGGGFIGLEMAENLNEAGVNVTLVEMQNQVMAPLDFEMANLVHENMNANGVELILSDRVESFEDINGRIVVSLKSGNKITTDMVILSIGVKSNSNLANDAGIKINNRGGIVVNDYLQTSKKDIYAVGDVIEVDNFITKEKTMIPLAGPANKQARILADNLTGGKKKYNGTMGTAIAKVFNLNVASVGLNEKQLKELGKIKNKDYYTALIIQRSHAGYYPKSVPITFKMIFDNNGYILGAQIVGKDGVDKRIDTIATTMRLNGTIEDLESLEFAYAPPFSSAKDPVNMLGFVAENILSGIVSFIEYDEMDEMIADDSRDDEYTILDVTENIERMTYAIPKSYSIPLGQLRGRIDELDKDKLIIVYCAIGVRAYNAARILMQYGFSNVKVLSGGVSFYKLMHYKDRIVENKINAKDIDKDTKVLNCTGLQCPRPITEISEAINEMEDDEILMVASTDMGFASDIDEWCKKTGNTLVNVEKKDMENIIYIKKG